MEKIELTRSRKVAKARRKKLEKLYDKKPFIELIVAILSIPSILLLVILNFKSLTTNQNAVPTPTPLSNSSAGINGDANFFARPVVKEPKITQVSNQTQSPCNKNLGPVEITSPNEGDTINSNPVEVDISYDDSTYCSAVWSYRINGGSWSDYNNNSVALYNLPDGNVRFDLRVKSLASSDQTTLTRNFIYNGPSSAVLPTNASSSAY